MPTSLRMFAFRGKHPNFGDELNAWLWQRLLPGFFDNASDDLFLGVGSILYDTFDPGVKKVVFGSGYGAYTPAPIVDRNWDVFFVRGEHTARALSLPEHKGIGDSGILVRSCWDARRFGTRHPVSFIPHFESAACGNWPAVCERAGVHFVDPRWPVQRVLKDLSESGLVVAEAMHGAIIADALRIPWRAVLPLDPGNRAKWHDWASALGLSIEFETLGPSNVAEFLSVRLAWNRRLRNRIARRRHAINRLTGGLVFGDTVDRLARIATGSGQLSCDRRIANAHSKMLEALGSLKVVYSDHG